ncbi:MAG TPA: hypothetical protein VGL72_02610 [Bryobacteraceae bacterium]
MKSGRNYWGCALVMAGLSLTGCGAHPSPPLWPGSKYTEADRTRSMMRALEYIHRSANVPANFEQEDCDYVYCFYSIAATAKDPQLRVAAVHIAPFYAREWARARSVVPANANADKICHLTFGWLPAALLGENDSHIKPQLVRAAARFPAEDYILFDPAKEPPPSDIPAPCDTDHYRNPRGAKVCKKCGRALTMKSKYEVWLDALIISYSGDRYGVRLGGSYRDVLKWLPQMRPYPEPGQVSQGLFLDVLYALTHVVYTLNDYGRYRLPHDLLPQEFAYLKRNLGQAIAMHDPETMGEFLDALKSFGLNESDPVIQEGMTYILDTQRADGTWSPPDEKDYYTLYHSAWCAIDGLKDCRYEREGISFPELRPMIEAMK